MIKTFVKFITENKLFEIASVITPNIITSRPYVTDSYFEFKIDDDIYWLKIFLFNIEKSLNFNDKEILNNITDLSTIRIDFDLKDNKNKLTNKNNPLTVLGNVIGIIKHWSTLDLSEIIGEGEEVHLKDVNIRYISLDAKCENENDLRRSNIYNFYFEKFINSKIKNKKSQKIKVGNDFTQMTTYEVEEINVKKFFK